MPTPLCFKEPVSSDYLYIDDDNRVHLMMPIVGGDEIGIDNTCKTAMELKRFFFGRVETDDASTPHQQKVYPSAIGILKKYVGALKQDIEMLESLDDATEYKTDLLDKKNDRLLQIQQYIQLIDDVTRDENIKYVFHPDFGFPLLPTGINTILADAKNAFGIRLAPYEEDSFVRIEAPLFSVLRDEFSPITGLGYQLRTGLTPDSDPIAIQPRSPKSMVVTKILDKIGRNRIVTKCEGEIQPSDNGLEPILFDNLKSAIEEELQKIEYNHDKITDDSQRVRIECDNCGTLINYDYAHDFLAYDSNTTISEWIDGLISAGIQDSFWNHIPHSVFYDIPGNCLTVESADALSLKVQFFLGEVNGFCKMHHLSECNFGDFFDQDDAGKELAGIVKQGLIDGESIETLILGYINQNRGSLGLRDSLMLGQQAQITELFNKHYTTIKGAPHFDEFLIANPDLPGSVYTHRGKMCVHFYEFLLHQRPGMGQSLKQSISSMLDEFRPKSNRLANKNLSLIKQMLYVYDVMQQLGESPSLFLEKLLSAHHTHGFPVYQLLTDEQRQRICSHYHWDSIETQIDESNERCKVYWSMVSTKPLIKEELSNIADGLKDIVSRYKKNRPWYLIPKQARKEQCRRLLDLANEIKLLKNNTLSETEILSQILKAIHTLNELETEISAEDNFRPSQLKKEVGLVKNALIEHWKIRSNTVLAKDISTAWQIQKETRLSSISDPDLSATTPMETSVQKAKTEEMSQRALSEAGLRTMESSLNALLDQSASNSGKSIINRLLHQASTIFLFSDKNDEKSSHYQQRYQQEIQLIQTALKTIASSCANQENILPDEERQRIMTVLSQFKQCFTESIVSPIQSVGKSHLKQALADANQCVTMLDNILEQITPAARYTQSTSP